MKGQSSKLKRVHGNGSLLIDNLWIAAFRLLWVKNNGQLVLGGTKFYICQISILH
jgi:hypothetical protein